LTQSQTLEILKTGANVFLTGEPGAGKMSKVKFLCLENTEKILIGGI